VSAGRRERRKEGKRKGKERPSSSFAYLDPSTVLTVSPPCAAGPEEAEEEKGEGGKKKKKKGAGDPNTLRRSL